MVDIKLRDAKSQDQGLGSQRVSILLDHLRDRLPASPPQVGARTALDLRPYVLRANGRTAMNEIFVRLGLGPNDEIFITNSSGQTYISACVTCSVFNHCKPSRVLTQATKAIFVIHEYGVAHPRLEELLDWGREHDVPVIEDCAHTLDSSIGGQPVGTFGDYAVLSLPKLLPMAHGGVLIGRNSDDFPPTPLSLSAIQEEFRHLLPYLSWLSARRKSCFSMLRTTFAQFEPFFEMTSEVTPFFFGIWTDRTTAIRLRFPNVDWGSSMHSNLLLVPTNPLLSPRTIIKIVSVALQTTAP